ncbi:hypothetical protein [Bradyrhizobium sp. Tv2a-2]|uniref:hypothetical protein n=1 Tax=Bradyrhizobium sp. Tv2a-2 TaxID=113395 RepID=UPI00040CC448|nr:hypothetical protein [Bradyrhizobium sp. Tv2a-2]
MTQLADFSFVINNALQTIHVGAILAPLTTNTLAANVSLVQFDGATGVGQITYNDRQPLPEAFSDPSPYQTYVNQWITALASGSPALTLSQAQAIKCSLVNAIYAVKRQAAVSIHVTAGTYSWDATDSTVERVLAPLCGLLYVDPVNTVIGEVNTLITEIDTTLSTLNSTWATNFNTLNSNWPSQIQAALNNLVSEINASLPFQSGGATIAGVTGPSAVTFDSGLSGFSGNSTLTAPSISLIPVGQTTPVTLSPTDLQAIVVAINAQNASKQSTSLSKQAAINALTSITSVVSYDATTGW